MSTSMLGSVFNQYQISTNPAEPSKALQTKLRVLNIGKDKVPFSEFKGLGPPGLNLGQPGDIYIDLSPGFHALYARYPELWSLWPGPKDVSTLLVHPMCSDRCLWCSDATIGWFHPRNVRLNTLTASELLAESLKHQATHLEESKKRKRGAIDQSKRTKPPSMTNTSNQNRTSLEHPSPIDALSFLDNTTLGYSQPALEIIPDTTASVTQNSEYCIESPTADSQHQSAIPVELDHMLTSDDLDGHSDRNLHTSPKRIDLRKVSIGGAKVSDTYVRSADERIRYLEAENARLRQLLKSCQCKSISHDISSMVEVPPAAGRSDTLNGVVDTSTGIEAVSSVPVSEPATGKDRNTVDKIEADTLDECQSSVEYQSMNPSPISVGAKSLRMREIQRSVMFAKTGSLLICRICLGTKLEENERVDEAFQTAEDSPEVMQEHCEKEHPNDCEALMRLSDEELLGLVSLISSEC